MRKFSGIEKVAAFLSLIGEDAATELFKYFDSIELARIVPIMSRIKLTQEEAQGILQEFSEKVRNAPVIVDEEYIKTVLTKAFGEEQAVKLISKIESGASAFDVLRWLDPGTIASMFQREHPQTIAIVLAHLEPAQAAEVLKRFSEHLKTEVAQRIANLEQISPTVLSELEDVLQSQLRSYTKSRRIGGVNTVAEILNQIDRASEESILKSIEEKNPILADEIRKLMFTFEDLLYVDDRGIQTILREISTDDLALALKMASEELKEKIFKNMSQRAVEILKEELELKGPVRVSEVEKAQLNIVRVARRLEEEGKIIVSKRAGEAVVI